MPTSGFFSSERIARMISSDRLPSWLNFLSRWACESDGVDCSLSMASRSATCSSEVRYGDAEVTIANNTLEGSGSCALYLRDLPYCRILANHFQNSLGSSIQCQGNMGGTVLNDNEVDKPIEIMPEA